MRVTPRPSRITSTEPTRAVELPPELWAAVLEFLAAGSTGKVYLNVVAGKVQSGRIERLILASRDRG